MIVLVCGTAVSAGQAEGATKPPPQSALVTAIDRCRQVADPTQRLACYDAAAGSLVQAARSGAVTVVDRGQIQQARRSLFGFTMPKLPFLTGDSETDKGMERLDTTIRSVKGLNSGRIQIVVAADNAVWEILEPPISFDDPRPGQKVSIRRGTLGTYYLTVNGQVAVKGRRIA